MEKLLSGVGSLLYAMRINDPKCVAKTFPEYFAAFAGIAKDTLI